VKSLRPIGAALGVLAAILPPARAAAATHMDYYGGPVVSNVKVYEVFWGPNVDGALKTNIDGFWSTIVASPYVDWVGEYDTVGQTSISDGDAGTNQRVKRGAYGGSITITPSNSGTTLTFDDVATELQAQIAAKVLPDPEVDSQGFTNTFFAVDFPQGITLEDQYNNQSCVTFCAEFHDFKVGNQYVYFVGFPYLGAGSPCAGGCGTSVNVFDNETFVHSLELLNVLTTPLIGEIGNTLGRPAAWYSTGTPMGPSGDACVTSSPNFGTVDGYVVGKGWSNRKAACIVSDATLPLCAGTTRPCRPCAPTSDAGPPDCTGNAPACDTTPGNPNQGFCVQCASDGDCGAGKVCDRQTDTCVAAPVDAGSSVDAGADATSSPEAGDDAGTNGGGGGGCSCDASPDSGTFATSLVALVALVAWRQKRVERARKPV